MIDHSCVACDDYSAWCPTPNTGSHEIAAHLADLLTVDNLDNFGDIAIGLARQLRAGA
jgi:hypothetical protein